MRLRLRVQRRRRGLRLRPGVHRSGPRAGCGGSTSSPTTRGRTPTSPPTGRRSRAASTSCSASRAWSSASTRRPGCGPGSWATTGWPFPTGRRGPSTWTEAVAHCSTRLLRHRRTGGAEPVGRGLRQQLRLLIGSADRVSGRRSAVAAGPAAGGGDGMGTVGGGQALLPQGLDLGVVERVEGPDHAGQDVVGQGRVAGQHRPVEVGADDPARSPRPRCRRRASLP